MSVMRAAVAPLLLSFVLGGVVAQAQAQQAPPTPAATPATPTTLSILVVDVQSLITHRYPSLDAVPAAFAGDHRRPEYVKGVVVL